MRRMSPRLIGVSIVLFAAGGALLALSVLRGEGAAGLALFIPFFYGTGPLAFLAVLLFFSGGLCLIAGFLRRLADAWEEGAPDEAPLNAGNVWRALWRGDTSRKSGSGSPDTRLETAGARTRGGAVVLIGPIPIVYGSDPGIARWMLLLALVLMAALLMTFVLLVIL